MNEKFSSRLRKVRGEKSQAEFCALLDVKQGTYSTWELGKYEPTLDMVTKIARVTNTTTDWLLGLAQAPPGKTLHSEMSDNADLYLDECQECKKKAVQIERLERIIDKLTK